MDEILYPTLLERREAETVSEAPAKTLAQRMEEWARKYDEFMFRWDEWKQHHQVRPKGFLATALLIGVVSTAVTLYTPGYAVMVGGQELGRVRNKAQFTAIEEQVEGRVGQILGREYSLENQVTFKFRVVNKHDLSTAGDFEAALFNQVNEVTPGCVLTMGDQTLSVQADGQALEELLDSLKAPYVNENTIDSGFTNPLTLSYEYVGVGQITDNLDQIRALLTSNTIEAATYTVQSGDTASAIAKRQGMSLSELMAMNPGVDANWLMIGQELTVRQSVPYLGVRTVDRLTYEEVVAPPVEYVNDDTMYQGDTKVLDPGAEGLDLVTADITYISGTEDHRDELERQVITEPLTKVVAQGTKERPKTMPKGYFIWPTYGTITSGFGGRSLFGTYRVHEGIDISVPYGSSIKAADGGTVTKSGWSNGYGYYIIIDHGGGKQSLYGHNSKLLVSAGEKVYQGQVIAKAGSTGRSTGTHCHFEVRINGQATNPRNYLP